MQSRYLRIAALAILVIAAYFLWSKRDPPSQSDQDNKTESRNISEERPTAPRERQERGALSSISGIVLNKATQEPLPGARIALSRKRLDNGLVGIAGKAPAPLVQVSSADGRFRFHPLNAGQYSLSIAAKGFMPIAVDSLPLAANEEKSDLRFSLKPGGHKLFGSVTDIGGGPVAFALVRAKDFSSFQVSSLFRAPFTAMTNASGEYELYLDDGQYQVDVFHEDYRSEKRRLAIGGQDLNTDFILTPGSAVEGKVLRISDNSPVEGAMVTWTGMGKTRGFALSGVALNGSALTDASGHFSLRGLGNGSFEIRAVSRHASTKEPTIVSLSIAETASDIIVYVDEAYTISGHVMRKEDESSPEAGVMVGAYNVSPGALFAGNNPSAQDGFFEIQGVQPGSYTVGAAAEERLPNFFGTAVTVVDQDITDLLITVDSGYTISGRVSPPQEANLALQIDMQEIGFSSVISAASSALVNGRSLADGSFVLHGVGAGTFTLVANTEDGSEGTTEIQVDSDLKGIVLAIEERAQIRGIVTDSDGRPVSGARVQFKNDSESSVRSFTANSLAKVTLTGNDGRFVHKGLANGHYGVTVHKKFQLQWSAPAAKAESRYSPKKIEVVDNQNPAPLKLVVVANSHAITGVVLDSEGSPLPDAWVSARWNEDKAMTNVRANRRQRERPVLTDEAGEFKLEDLRAGSYTLWVEALHGSAKGKQDKVLVDTHVELKVEALGTLTGSVQIGNTPIEDYLLNIHGPTKRRVRIQNSEGAFTLKALEAGKYTLSVSCEEGVSTTAVRIESGKTATVAIALATFGSIRGIVLDAVTGDPIAGLAVIAHVGKDRSQWAASAMQILDGSGPRTDENGHFRIERLNEGEGVFLILDPDAKGFAPLLQRDFTLSVGEDLDLETVEVKRAQPEGD